MPPTPCFSFFFFNFPNPHLFCWCANIQGLFFIMSFCLWGCLFLRVHELADNEKWSQRGQEISWKIKQKPRKPLRPAGQLHGGLRRAVNSSRHYSGEFPWWLKKLPKRVHWISESHHSCWVFLQDGLNKIILCGKTVSFYKEIKQTRKMARDIFL